MNRKSYYLPQLVAYMPIVHNELDIAITSIKNLIARSKRLDKFVLVGTRDVLHKVQKVIENDRRLVFLETRSIDISSGTIWQQMIQEFPECDLLRVAPGVSVPLFWDSTLQQSAYRQAVAGSVSPLCNDSSLFRLFNDPVLESEASQDLNLVNAILHRLKVSRTFQAPVFSPALVFIKGKMLADVFSSALKTDIFDDSSLSERAYHLGFINIICGDVYIHNVNRSTDQKHIEIDKRNDVGLINVAHPASVLRHLASDAFAKRSSFIDVSLPVQLHVMHSWGGGLHKWVGDFCNNDKSRRNLVLKSIGDWDAFGKRLALYEHPDAPEPIDYWDLGTPVQAVDLRNIEYREVLEEIINKYGIDVIWVSSLIGHSLDVLDTDVKTGFICHDYFPICPAINIYFDGVCSTCDENKMSSCFDNNEHNRFFKNCSTKKWFAVRETFSKYVLSNGINLIIPTPSIKDYLVSLQPKLDAASFKYIPHGKENSLLEVKNNENKAESKGFCVVVLGELAPHKGKNLLLNIIEQLPGNIYITLLGCGHGCGSFKKYKNITIVEKYSHDVLPEIITEIDPDIGLLLSVWPETYSYTLSELMELGIPPVATEIGAFKDRIVDGENGFVFEAKPGILLDLLRRLSMDRQLVQEVKENLKNIHCQKSNEMVTDYHDLTGEYNFNSLSVLCVGNAEHAKQNKTRLLFSNELDMAINEFDNLLRLKINQNNYLRAYSKHIAILVIETWLIFPRLVSRVNAMLRK